MQVTNFYIRVVNGVPVLGSLVKRTKMPTGGKWVMVEASALGACCAFNDILQSPANFAASVGSPTSTAIVLNWTASPAATNYVVERAISQNFSSSTVIYNGPLLTTNSTGLAPSTLYYYRISATGPSLHKSAFTYASRSTTA